MWIIEETIIVVGDLVTLQEIVGIMKLWNKGNAKKEGVGSCNRDKGEIYAEEKKSVSIVKGGERRGMQVYRRKIERKGISDLQSHFKWH